MKRSAILVLLLATATVCAGPPGESPKAPVSSPLEIADLEAEFGTLIPPLLEKFNVPGASVAVLVEGTDGFELDRPQRTTGCGT